MVACEHRHGGRGAVVSQTLENVKNSLFAGYWLNIGTAVELTHLVLPCWPPGRVKPNINQSADGWSGTGEDPC